jgi:hypothetical protein
LLQNESPTAAHPVKGPSSQATANQKSNSSFAPRKIVKKTYKQRKENNKWYHCGLATYKAFKYPKRKHYGSGANSRKVNKQVCQIETLKEDDLWGGNILDRQGDSDGECNISGVATG